VEKKVLDEQQHEFLETLYTRIFIDGMVDPQRYHIFRRKVEKYRKSGHLVGQFERLIHAVNKHLGNGRLKQYQL